MSDGSSCLVPWQFDGCMFMHADQVFSPCWLSDVCKHHSQPPLPTSLDVRTNRLAGVQLKLRFPLQHHTLTSLVASRVHGSALDQLEQ